jgi:hypothetical protein
MLMRMLLLVVLLSGAGRVAAQAGGRGTVMRDSAGISIVTNWTPAWTAGSGWSVDPRPITSIGGDESDPQQHFQYVRSARRLPDGRIVIAVGGELRWFGPDGKYLRTMPRAGSGPGEFREIGGVQLRGDSIVLFGDFQFLKSAAYSRTGALLRDDRVDYGRIQRLGNWTECLLELFPDGSRTACRDDPTIPRTATNRPRVNGDPGPGLLREMQRLYLVPPALDTSYRLGALGGIEQFGLGGVAGSRSTRFYMHPFYSYSYVAAGGTPMRIALVTNPAYSIEIWTPTGKLERIIRRPSGKRVPTAAEKAAAVTSFGEQLLERHDSSNPAAILAKMPIPDSLPAAYGLVIGPDDELFVQRQGTWAVPGASRFDVFDRSGRWLGELALPPRTRLLDAGRDNLLAVRIDDNDVPHLDVYRLHRR